MLIIVVFSPKDLFLVLYKDHVYNACKNGLFVDKHMDFLVLPSGLSKSVEETLRSLFEDLVNYAGTAAATLHQLKLWELNISYSLYHSDDTCLSCLRNRPQYRLSCGHCICENCFQALGKISETDPWIFGLDRCILCKHPTLGMIVKVVPKTAGIRVLTFDGGGVRIVIALICLLYLEEAVDLDFPIYENFDMVYGTSSGESSYQISETCVDSNSVVSLPERFV